MENQPKSEWQFRKYNALDGQVAVEYVRGESRIEARASGVQCKVEVQGHGDLQDFAQALSKAWKDHEQLKGALLNKLMGKH